ncbi:hypothetical protein CDL15_Pgr022231 [Punica granatum]|uniref:Uncharacterized protein n=1 Tax=Punica granatum TaxID=22663 RepID=A0A218WNM1_PUNGR|nr:hypothetical protein CDL15_Pgr022231 [Punica granatum]
MEAGPDREEARQRARKLGRGERWAAGSAGLQRTLGLRRIGPNGLDSTAVPTSGRRGDGARGRGRLQRAPPGLRRARDGRHEARAGPDFEFFLRFFEFFRRGVFELNRLKSGEIERRKWRGFVRGSVVDRLRRKTKSERARLGVDFTRDPPVLEQGPQGFVRDRVEERGKAARERAGEVSGGVSGECVSGGRRLRWVGSRGVSKMTEGLQ